VYVFDSVGRDLSPRDKAFLHPELGIWDDGRFSVTDSSQVLLEVDFSPVASPFEISTFRTPHERSHLGGYRLGSSSETWLVFPLLPPPPTAGSVARAAFVRSDEGTCGAEELGILSYTIDSNQLANGRYTFSGLSGPDDRSTDSDT